MLWPFRAKAMYESQDKGMRSLGREQPLVLKPLGEGNNVRGAARLRDIELVHNSPQYFSECTVLLHELPHSCRNAIEANIDAGIKVQQNRLTL
jgi:hypothetical protein